MSVALSSGGAKVSPKPGAGGVQSRKVLVCGVNWLGDSIMTMPALRLFMAKHPSDRLTMLVKPGMESLWGLFPGLDQVRRFGYGLSGLWQTSGQLRNERWDAAYVLPRAARSALIPFCAGIPERIGREAHECRFLLTRAIKMPLDPRHHQALEYANIFGVSEGGCLPHLPPLEIPPQILNEAAELLGGPGPWIGLVPGAARGPSKRWPDFHFAAAGRRLAAESGVRCLVFGSQEEIALCRAVSEGIGSAALNLAGQTTLPQLAALMGLCRVVVTNDCGGMHLAAAMGTPVVAVFGLTDPSRTGPLGNGHRLVCAEGVRRSRDIGRYSRRARRVMESISPERVIREALAALRDGMGAP